MLRRIGILGHYGFGNLGDDAVVAILIRELHKRFPFVDVCGFSLNPRDTERRHGIKTFPIRRGSDTSMLFERPEAPIGEADSEPLTVLKAGVKRHPRLYTPLRRIRDLVSPVSAVWAELSFLRRSRKRLHGIDLLLVPGSGHLNDFWGGPWRHPYTLLSWALLARLSGVPVIVLSVGAGQLRTRLGKLFCKWFLQLTTYRSFRDRYSKEFMERLGLEGENPVFPDQGFALVERLDYGGFGVGSTDGRGELVIGINPVAGASYILQGTDEAPQRKYVETITRVARWLLEEKGCQIAFCPSNQRSDHSVLEQIKAGLGTSHLAPGWERRIIDDPVNTVDDLLDRIRTCDIVIASRFHGVVLPFMLGKPVLGLSYSRKISDLMGEGGQGEYCVDILQLDFDDLVRRFLLLEANRTNIGMQLKVLVSGYRRSLEEQYDVVFDRFGENA